MKYLWWFLRWDKLYITYVIDLRSRGLRNNIYVILAALIISDWLIDWLIDLAYFLCITIFQLVDLYRRFEVFEVLMNSSDNTAHLGSVRWVFFLLASGKAFAKMLPCTVPIISPNYSGRVWTVERGKKCSACLLCYHTLLSMSTRSWHGCEQRKHLRAAHALWKLYRCRMFLVQARGRITMSWSWCITLNTQYTNFNKPLNPILP